MHAQLYLTLCNPVDSRPPGSSSMRFSRIDYWSGLLIPPSGDLPNPEIEPVSPTLSCTGRQVLYSEPLGKSICIYMRVLSHFSCVQFFVTLRTVALQALQSMGFSSEEYWSGWPDPAGDLPDPGSNPGFIYIYIYCD